MRERGMVGQLDKLNPKGSKISTEERSIRRAIQCDPGLDEGSKLKITKAGKL